MKIISLTTGYMDSHCYLVIERGRAIVIDPGDAETVLPVITAMHLQVDFGILTHEHCDHVFGCIELQDKLGIPFYASSACNRNMQDTKKNFSRYFDAFVGIQTKDNEKNWKKMPQFTAKADRIFEGERSLDWCSHCFLLRETPGHSEGSICILVDQRELFAGDSLLANELTGLRFAGSSWEQLTEKTIPWLKSLPGEIRVWPGHGPSFILGKRLQKPIIDENKSKGERQ